MKNHRSMILHFWKTHEGVYKMLKGKKFHYIVILLQDNIGDLLTMKGTLAFFKKKNFLLKTTSAAWAFDPVWVRPDDNLVFYGGRDCGDLYANINDLHEGIITRFRNNRVVMLPRTICFTTDKKRDRSTSVFRRHPCVHIFVRNKVSPQIAAQFSDHAYLTPDMAHQLYPIPSKDICEGVLRIERVDIGKPAVQDSLKDMRYDTRVSWVEAVGTEKRLIDFARRLQDRFIARGWRVCQKLVRPWYWVPVAQRFSSKAVALFSRHDHIVTDRLHMHILSSFMDKKNIPINNSFGKNFAYINGRTVENDPVRLAGA